MVNGWAASFVSQPEAGHVGRTGPRDGDVARGWAVWKQRWGLVWRNGGEQGVLVDGTRVQGVERT
jgi:hypothetical protein